MRRTNRHFLTSCDFFLPMLGENEELFPRAGMIFCTFRNERFKNERCHSGGIATAYIVRNMRESGDFISTQKVSLVHPHWKIELWRNWSKESRGDL